MNNLSIEPHFSILYDVTRIYKKIKNGFCMMKKIYLLFSLTCVNLYAHDVTLEDFLRYGCADRHNILVAVATAALRSPQGIRPFIKLENRCPEILEHVLRGQLSQGLDKLLEGFDPEDAYYPNFFSDENLTEFVRITGIENQSREHRFMCSELMIHLVQLHCDAAGINGTISQALRTVSSKGLSSFLSDLFHQRSFFNHNDRMYQKTVEALQKKLDVQQQKETEMVDLPAPARNTCRVQ